MAVDMPDSDDEVTAEKEDDADADGWIALKRPHVFKDVHLRQLVAPENKELLLDASAVRPRHGPAHRSLCRVRLKQLSPADGQEQDFEFRLGDIYGYNAAQTTTGSEGTVAEERGQEPCPQQWEPPLESQKTDVPSWLTEAALRLALGVPAVQFEVTLADNSVENYEVELLAVTPTYDILGDGGIVLRFLEGSGDSGEKPRDLATVRASWRVWFQRNAQLILNSSSKMQFAPDGADISSAETGMEFLIDAGQIAVSLECAIKEMPAGTRAILAVTEEWGRGPLTPEGSPLLKGAAIWAEIMIHSVVNEPTPAKLGTASAVVEFSLEKKQQGNEFFVKGTAAEYARAFRRYEAGIKALEAILPDEQPADGDKAARKLLAEAAPAVGEETLPAVDEALVALRLNCAQAELKREQWQSAAELCDAVFRRAEKRGVVLDVRQVAKARYRRALARTELGNYDGAIEDLRSAAVADPTDVGVRRELSRAEGLRKEQREDEKKLFGGVVEKMEKKEEARKKAIERREAKKKEAAEKKRKEDWAKRQQAHNEMLEKEGARIAREEEEAKEKAAKEAADAALKAVGATPSVQGRLPGMSDKASKLLEQLGGSTNTESTTKTNDDDDEDDAAPVMPNFTGKPAEKPPPVNYNVPSFLQKKAKPKIAKS